MEETMSTLRRNMSTIKMSIKVESCRYLSKSSTQQRMWLINAGDMCLGIPSLTGSKTKRTQMPLMKPSWPSTTP